MTRAALLSDPTTRRAFQLAYDNAAPDESGPWCETEGCTLGTEDNVVTLQRMHMYARVRQPHVLCPACRAAAEVEALGSACEALEDALAHLPLSHDASHRVTSLRATLASALAEAQAERASWEAVARLERGL